MLYMNKVDRIIKESINSFLLRETWNSSNAELKSHLQGMKNFTYDDLLEIASVYPSCYIEYLERLYPEVFDEHEYELYSIVDDESETNMSFYIRQNNLPIDERFGKYARGLINHFPSRYRRDAKVSRSYSETPDKITIQYIRPILNKVCIHFTQDDRDAEDILQNGFKYGQKLDNLAWSMGVKDNGNYCFSYLLDDYVKNNCNVPEELKRDVMSLNGIGYPKYGNNAIIFIGSGCLIQHLGDTKTLSASMGETVKEVINDKDSVKILCLIRSGKVLSPDGKLLVQKESFDDAVEWFNNNLRKY